MPSTFSLLKTLKQDFSDIVFSPSDRFHWSPDERVIYYGEVTDVASLLHEVAHATLGHTGYRYDVELLKMERDAWDFTKTTLVKKYKVAIDDERIESMLDTYRDWLHDRSLCPNCEATGIQIAINRYSCLACSGAWRVNEARSCALRRYELSATDKEHKK